MRSNPLCYANYEPIKSPKTYFCVTLGLQYCCWLSNYIDIEGTLFSFGKGGWLVTAPGGIEKYAPPDMCSSNQGPEGGNLLKRSLGRKRWSAGLQVFFPFHTKSHFWPKTTWVSKLQSVKGSEIWENYVDRKTEWARDGKTWYCANQIWQGSFSQLYSWYFLSAVSVNRNSYKNKTENA